MSVIVSFSSICSCFIFTYHMCTLSTPFYMQAICELYNRPAEIWAYDSQRGARKLRTFHETASASTRAVPLRLSYYGGGHYDSVVDDKHDETVLRTTPGVVEEEALRRAEERIALALASSAGTSLEEARRVTDAEATEQAELDMAMELSRAHSERDRIRDDGNGNGNGGTGRFNWQDDDLETCLIMSLEESYNNATANATTTTATAGHKMPSADRLRSLCTAMDSKGEAHEGQDSGKTTGLAGLGADLDLAEAVAERGILRSVAEESEREYLEKQLLSSLAKDSAMGAASGAMTKTMGGTVTDDEIEQQLLEQVRLESLRAAEAETQRRLDQLTSRTAAASSIGGSSSSGSVMGAGGTDSSTGDDADLELALRLSSLSEEEAFQLALQQSVAGAAGGGSVSSSMAPGAGTGTSSSSVGASLSGAASMGLEQGFDDEDAMLKAALAMSIESAADSDTDTPHSSRISEQEASLEGIRRQLVSGSVTNSSSSSGGSSGYNAGTALQFIGASANVDEEEDLNRAIEESLRR